MINSAAGVAALIFGTMQGFALASQFRPAFMAIILSLFGLKMTAGQTFRMAVAFTVSLAIAADGSIFKVWTAIFLGTVLLQCLLFALINKAGDINPIAFASLYNLVGAIISVTALFFLGVDFPDTRSTTILLLSSSLSVAGSVALIVAFAKTSSSASSIGLYLRLPLSIIVGYLVFNETPTILAATLAVILMVLLIYDAWRSAKK